MDTIYSHLPKKLISKTQSLMLHALGFVTGDPTINIDYPYVYHPGLQVSANKPGDSKWIYMMLPLPLGSLITNINIAYHRTGLQNQIKLIRLIEQREPISATVVHNEYIEENMPSTGVIGVTCRVVVNQSIMLKVGMDFHDPDDIIELGSVEVRYIPGYTISHDLIKKREKNIFSKTDQRVDIKGNNFSLNMRKASLAELFSPKKTKKESVFEKISRELFT